MRTCPSCEKEHAERYDRCAACRAEDPLYPSLRACGKCGERKALSAFSKSKNASAWCRACCQENASRWRAQNLDHARATDRARGGRQKTPEARAAQRLYRLLNRYGLTIEEYDEIVERQGGGCAICGIGHEADSGRWSRLSVDHDHGSGEVRGILCNSCNTALGHFHDDPERLRRAIHYLLGEPVPIQAGVLT